MKLTVWIRPDPRDPTGRDITLRVDYKLESRDNPVIQRYGRKLLNAIEGTAEKPEESALIPNLNSPTAGRAGSAETAEAKDAAVRPEVKR